MVKSKRGEHTIAWIAAALLLFIGSYAAAYLNFTHVRVYDASETSRGFKSAAVARLFIPAAWAEAKITRKHVSVFGPLGTEIWVTFDP